MINFVCKCNYGRLIRPRCITLFFSVHPPHSVCRKTWLWAECSWWPLLGKPRINNLDIELAQPFFAFSVTLIVHCCGRNHLWSHVALTITDTIAELYTLRLLFHTKRASGWDVQTGNGKEGDEGDGPQALKHIYKSLLFHEKICWLLPPSRLCKL